jgi:hypothetical protein
MFTIHFFIDSIQSAKRAVAEQVFSDPTLKKAANSYIDAQTQFAKMLVNNTTDMAKYSMDNITKCWYPSKEQASQAPYKVDKEAK